ncbi:hypothetical protein ACI2JA_21335 [Alkalihalobacillus sp. NPDC078783]
MDFVQSRKISLVMVFSLIVAMVMVPINSSALANSTQDVSKETVVLSEEEKSSIRDLEEFGVDSELMLKVLEVSHHISINADQETLSVALSDEELTNEHSFTETQLQDFKAMLNGTYQAPASQVSEAESDQVLAASSGYRAGYLNNFDLKAGTFAVLGSAAAVGPAALMTAWAGVSTLLGGPLGAVAGISTAVLGGAFFADLALKITGALSQGKGVAFYLDWGIPPVKTAIE